MTNNNNNNNNNNNIITTSRLNIYFRVRVYMSIKKFKLDIIIINRIFNMITTFID